MAPRMLTAFRLLILAAAALVMTGEPVFAQRGRPMERPVERRERERVYPPMPGHGGEASDTDSFGSFVIKQLIALAFLLAVVLVFYKIGKTDFGPLKLGLSSAYRRVANVWGLLGILSCLVLVTALILVLYAMNANKSVPQEVQQAEIFDQFRKTQAARDDEEQRARREDIRGIRAQVTPSITEGLVRPNAEEMKALESRLDLLEGKPDRHAEKPHTTIGKDKPYPSVGRYALPKPQEDKKVDVPDC